MLIGEYRHTIDVKKRLAIPSKLRLQLGKKAVITRGLDGCLFIYPLEAWKNLVEKLSKLPVGQGKSRSFIRIMLSGASEVEQDRLGRVLVPDYLKIYAGLRKKVALIGVYDRVEIWDEAKWQTYKTRVEKDTDKLAEQLGELGI